jgi:ABC-type phosphate/phosphonate transport system substrate-binding protein
VGRVLGFSVGLLALVAAASPAGAENPAPNGKAKEIRIGLLKPMFKDVPTALINAAAQPFKQMIQQKTGLAAEMEIVPGYKELAGAIREGKIDVAVFHGFEYAWVKDTPNLKPLVVAMPNCGCVQACLVVHKDSKARTPACLKNQSVLVPKGTKAHCTMFLDRVRQKLPPADCCPLKANGHSIEEALFEVGGGDADAALVDISALKALETGYPGCFKQIRVLDESKPLPAAVVVYRDGALEAKIVDQLRDGLIDCVNTPAGRTFAMFWQLKGFSEVSPAYEEQVKLSLKAYPEPGDAKPVTVPVAYPK